METKFPAVVESSASGELFSLSVVLACDVLSADFEVSSDAFVVCWASLVCFEIPEVVLVDVGKFWAKNSLLRM